MEKANYNLKSICQNLLKYLYQRLTILIDYDGDIDIKKEIKDTKELIKKYKGILEKLK
jgi:hypothetical protein